MGNSYFIEKSIDLAYTDVDQIDGKDINNDDRILWVHGWRCNDQIYNAQSYALRTYIAMKATFICAPFAAIGPPDPLIAQFFPNQSYYEWFYKVSETNYERYNGSIDEDKSLKDSILSITEFLRKRDFKILVGFSQGCLIITNLLEYYQKYNLKIPFEKVVLICGVAPLKRKEKMIQLNIPSLHIHGAKDPYYQRSTALQDFYTSPIILKSSESHNIPSKLNNLDIYEQVKEFCYN